MAQRKNIPIQISPYVWAYLSWLKKYGVPITRAYVFGSWAKGTQNQWSDIDLCVVSRAFTSWDKKVKQLVKAAIIPDLELIEAHGFHPKDFNPNTSSLANEIIKHGIRVI